MVNYHLYESLIYSTFRQEYSLKHGLLLFKVTKIIPIRYTCNWAFRQSMFPSFVFDNDLVYVEKEKKEVGVLCLALILNQRIFFSCNSFTVALHWTEVRTSCYIVFGKLL